MRRFAAIMSYFCLFSALYGLSRCAIFNVTVGGPGVLQYSPEFVSGGPGDTVRFIFMQRNHTVTQSTLQTPCRPLKGGFDSGFVPVANSMKDGFPVAELRIPDESPIWVYCRQGDHCQQGMVFAVNPGDNFGAFKSAAVGQPVPSSAPLPSLGVPASTVSTSVTIVPTATSPSSIVVVTVTATVTAALTPSATSSSTSSPTPTPIDHRVIVGGPGLLIFQPSNTKAIVGDTITFEFRQKNHTVTASSFNRPCEPLSSTSTTGEVGFDSGFMPVAETSSTFPTFTIRVNDTKPIWAYCRQGNHCGQGMVFAANAVEDSPDNFAAFQGLAKQLNGTASANGDPSSNSASRASGANWVILIGVTGALGFGSFL